MNRNRTIAAVVALIALGGTAHAATNTLKAGPAYAGAEQLGGRVFCWIANTGTTSVLVHTREILNGFRAAGLAGDTCAFSLLPGHSCDFFAHAGSGTYTCRAVITGAETDVSGTMQIYTNVSTDHLLLTVPMSK